MIRSSENCRKPSRSTGRRESAPASKPLSNNRSLHGDRYLRAVSQRPPSRLALGNAALRAGRHAEAIAHYAWLICQSPELAETLALADNLALARQRHHRASSQHGSPWRDSPCPARVAVVVHIYYPELWPEIAEALSLLVYPFDLYVTITPDTAPDITSRVRSAFPAAHIQTYPNRGMDVLPFLRLAPTLIQADYQAVCKLHTKRGDGQQGITWRRAMLDPLIGDNTSFVDVAEAFARDPRLQLVGPAPLYQSAQHLMRCNEPLVSRLYQQLTGQGLPAANWGFFAGTMFWVRPRILQALAKLIAPGAVLDPELFETDYQQDGQRVHALERVFGVLPSLHGGEVGLVHHALNGGWCLQLPPPRPRTASAQIWTLMPQYEQLTDKRQEMTGSGQFDVGQYLQQWPELAGTQIDPLTHYLLIGVFEHATES
ncbi:rhamnan synthesis F family protein [Allochromatium palmeri]|uniref:Glycosyl transferase family 1 n=1 Tax=Allochromatium palmeri TaxID=231048 RepID=A0A6N8EK27_9GAMM|nr:rhamnan synthesis F family protein [Allochromatium palmeri]MTW22684.1 hypothetical protein [Allochromatium palmeri]